MVGRYDLALILDKILFTEHLVSLLDLNQRLDAFSYDKTEHINKPPHLSESQIRNHCLIMSSSEMLTLIRNLGFIIGHLILRTNKYWHLFIKLQNLVEVLVSSISHVKTPDLLENLVTEYLVLLSELFPGEMKPKHHFLLHYPRIMRAIGPIWNVNCIRFEATHRIGKITSHAAISRVNVCRTIALKHQLMLNYRFLQKESTYEIFTVGPTKSIAYNQLGY